VERNGLGYKLRSASQRSPKGINNKAQVSPSGAAAERHPG